LPLWALDKYWLNEWPQTITLHLLLAWIALRLLRFKRNKDWLWLYVASFLAVLLTASVMLDARFFVLLVIYLLAGISTLVSFEIRRAQDEWQRQHAQAAFTIFWRHKPNAPRLNLRTPRWHNVFIFACLSLLLIAALAAPLFLAMPRVPRPWSGGRNDSRGGEALSGFSETVRLGEIGRLKLNRQRMMRVRVTWPPNTTPQQLYWRGLALDHYQGGMWISTVPRPLNVPESSGGFYVSDVPNEPPPFTDQQFLLEPLNTNIVFAAPRAVWVSGPDRLRRDDSDALFTNHHSFHRYRYQVQSDTRLPRADALRADQAISYGYEIRDRYLQLPPQLDTRIGKLARDVAGDAKTNYDIAARLVEHLQNAYQYSLDLKVVEEGDPLSDFLFNTKAGHCEYFASALTILLRTRGIPARLVNGFQMGEYSERQQLYTVRQSDAHSWVEVYFPRHGWVTFDPTPAAGPGDADELWAGMFGWLQGMGESLQTFWQERIIEFDSFEQFSMLMDMQRTLSHWRHEAGNQWFDWQSRLSEWFKADPPKETAGEPPDAAKHDFTQWLTARNLALAAALLTIVVVVWWWRHTRTWRYRFRRDATGSAVAFYEEMLAQLARAGLRRQSQQTPREFARQVNRPSVSELTQLYQQARFGGTALSVQQIDRIGELLHSLRERQSKQ
jgi:protein-glutamine gamma-glutamyltransferase